MISRPTDIRGPPATGELQISSSLNIGALIIRIGLWGFLLLIIEFSNMPPSPVLIVIKALNHRV